VYGCVCVCVRVCFAGGRTLACMCVCLCVCLCVCMFVCPPRLVESEVVKKMKEDQVKARKAEMDKMRAMMGKIKSKTAKNKLGFSF
jgi:L-lactate utilization protein LutB